jgi:hypothetical protein
MPFDLNAVERGYGECDVDWNGHTIVLRYRADLNNRALIAMKRAVVGVDILGGGSKFPDVEAMIQELERVLLPADHEYGPGWDLTDNGVPLPITFDSIVDLPPGLPAAMLGAIFRDINDPDRRRPSRNGSSRGASSEPTPSPTTTPSSAMPNGQASLPGPSPATPIAVGSGPAGESGFGV